MYKPVRLVFLFLILFFGEMFSQTHLQYLIGSGIDSAYNLDLEEAEKIFNKIIELYPDQPYGYHYIAQNHLWTFLGSKDEGEYQIFKKYSEYAVDKAEDKLDGDDLNYELHNLLGWAYTLRAMGYTAQGSSLDAFWASKSAVSHFEEALEINPEFYDAYLGLGIFDYALSFVPGIFKWALSLTGLSYDKDKGVEYIRIAFRKGKKCKTEASFHLAKIYTEYLGEYDSAATHLDRIITKYPRNSLFHYQRAILKIDSRNLDAAERSLDMVLKLNNPHFVQTNAFCLFLKGEIYFKRNQFRKAADFYNEFIEKTRSIDYTGAANLKLAICYHILNDTLESGKHLLLTGLGNPDIYDDQFAQEESEYLINNKITGDYILVVKAKNYLEAGSYDFVRTLLLHSADSIADGSIRSEAYIYLSEAEMTLKNYSEAIKCSKKALTLAEGRGKWIIPRTYFIMAQSYFKENKNDSAFHYLNKSLDFDDYRSQDKLSPRLFNLKRKLDHAGKN